MSNRQKIWSAFGLACLAMALFPPWTVEWRPDPKLKGYPAWRMFAGYHFWGYSGPTLIVAERNGITAEGGPLETLVYLGRSSVNKRLLVTQMLAALAVALLADLIIRRKERALRSTHDSPTSPLASDRNLPQSSN